MGWFLKMTGGVTDSSDLSKRSWRGGLKPRSSFYGSKVWRSIWRLGSSFIQELRQRH